MKRIFTAIVLTLSLFAAYGCKEKGANDFIGLQMYSVRSNLNPLDEGLANIAQAIARNGVNISGLSMNSTLDGRAKMKFQVEVRNATQLYKLIEDVRAMPSVLEVIRESESDDL